MKLKHVNHAIILASLFCAGVLLNCAATYNVNHSDEKRLKTVSKIDAPAVLEEIAQNDPSWFVRQGALHKIINPQVILELAKNDESEIVRSTAFSKLSTQEAIKDVVINGKFDDVRIEGLEKLKDDLISYEICKNKNESQNFQESAFKNITSVALLDSVTLYAAQPIIRKQALTKITSQQVLAQICFKKGERPDIQTIAVEKIKDTKLLEQIALSAPATDVRLIAGSQVTNEKVLEKICLKDDEQYNIQLNALDKITNPTIIGNIARNGATTQIRALAIGKTTDEDILLKICNNKYEEITLQIAAVKQIGSPATLEKLVRETKTSEVKIEAIRKIDNQDLLLKIAQHDTDDMARKTAIEKLKSPSALSTIAQNEENYQLRNLAVNKISDQKVLHEIYQNDTQPEVRLAALSRFSDIGLIVNIIDQSNNNEVIAIAKNRISAPELWPEIKKTSESTGIKVIPQKVRIGEELKSPTGKIIGTSTGMKREYSTTSATKGKAFLIMDISFERIPPKTQFQLDDFILIDNNNVRWTAQKYQTRNDNGLVWMDDPKNITPYKGDYSELVFEITKNFKGLAKLFIKDGYHAVVYID